MIKSAKHPLPHLTSLGTSTLTSPRTSLINSDLPSGKTICSHYTSEEFHCLEQPFTTSAKRLREMAFRLQTARH